MQRAVKTLASVCYTESPARGQALFFFLAFCYGTLEYFPLVA
jgi:hypothetical protein